MPEDEKETTEQQRLAKEQKIWARCGAPAAPMPSTA